MRYDAVLTIGLALIVSLGCPEGRLAGTAEIRAADRPGEPAGSGQLSPEESRAATIDALEEFNSLVGGWRGVGQPVRNSSKGAWTETGRWLWEIRKDRVALRLEVSEGRLLASGALTYDPSKMVYSFDATLPDKTRRLYSGTPAAKKLTLVTDADEKGQVHQLVITRLNEKRTLVLFQSRHEKQQQFARVAEIGYTREGTKLAEEGTDGPECIVTGGKGTMSTVYKGKTYWFCCTGCRDAFNDDPDAIVAEAARRAARKKPAAQGERPGS